MATNQTHSSDDRQTDPLLEKFGQIASAAGAGVFVYSVKIVCGKQTETNCGCCVAGTRPGLYATEVNIQNLNLVTERVLKFVLPLINSGAVVAGERNVADPAAALRGRARSTLSNLPRWGDNGRLLPHLGAAAGRGAKRRGAAHHRHSHDREPVRALRLRGLHGEPAQRRRRQH